MKKSFLSLLFFASLVINAQMKPMTAEQLYSVTRISNQTISPDGKTILYIESIPDIEKNTINSDICVIGIDGKNRRQLTKIEGYKSNPIWSSNGDKVSFIVNKDGVNSIYTMPFPNGNAKRIASFNESISNLQYSPNGDFFSFIKSVKIKPTISDKYPKYSKANVRVYDSLPIRQWDVWLDENVNHIFYMPVNGTANSAKDINANETFGGDNFGVAWSSDSKEIAYSVKKLTGAQAARSTNADVYIYTLANNKTENITQSMQGYDRYPLYSPDGKYIAFRSQERAGFESDKYKLMLFDRKTKNITEISKELDQWVEEYVWANDSKSLYVVATNYGCYSIFNVDLVDNKFNQISEGNYDYNGISISKDDKVLLCSRGSISEPVEIYYYALPNKEIKQVTYINKELMSKIAISKSEVKWITTRDGRQLHCWIVYPPNFDSSKKYPLITYCQGGPQQMISQAWGYRWNMSLFAAKDYVIVAPNRRGCPGFGQEWIDAISKNWGNEPMNDILDATDAMFNEPFIDRERAVAIGASAGGFTTYWLEGHSEGRFKAFLSHCGVFDFYSMYGATEELFFPDYDWGGPYWEEDNKEFYNNNSPSNFVQNWETPIIISTGEKDFRVPYTQSLEAFTAAQVRGIPSRILIYPDECHFISKVQEYMVWYNEVFDFFDKYCK